jgi:hypothetical protein
MMYALNPHDIGKKLIVLKKGLINYEIFINVDEIELQPK